MLLYNKNSNTITILDDHNYKTISEEEYVEYCNKYTVYLDLNLGTMGYENGKLTFVDRNMTMLVNRENLQFTVLTGSELTITEPYYPVTITAREFYEADQLRLKLTGQAVVLYWDDEFHTVYLKEDHYFDPKTKSLKLDEEVVSFKINNRLDEYHIAEHLTHRGFEFQIGGNTYLQPYRMEDKLALLVIKSDVPLANRELKLFNKTENFNRDSSSFTMISGEVVSDELLSGLLANIALYENNLKPTIREVIDEIKKLNIMKQLEESEKVEELVYNRLEEKINNK